MTGAKNKVWVWIIIVAVLAVVIGVSVWWYAGYQSESTPPAGDAAVPLSGGDTSAEIGKDLEMVDLGNVGSELNELDKDIDQL